MQFSISRAILCFTAIVAGGGPVSAAKFVQRGGITWTFDRDYPSGTFANGDPWVVGPVVVIEIDPGTATENGITRHGSMTNPAPNGPQAYDSRIRDNRFAPELNAAARLPLTLAPGSSLLSARSRDGKSTGHDPQLDTIAVLTVVAAEPRPGSFRPPYLGDRKSVRWNAADLDLSRLRSLPRVRSAPALDTVTAAFELPRIEQGTNWTGRYLHPRQNQPTYGREIAHQTAEALLLLQLDYPAEEKRPLLVQLVQYGLDIYGAARAGATWPADGGHNAGRKMPLLLAGILLDDPEILRFADGRGAHIFQEDQQTWYVGAEDVGRPLLQSDGRTRASYQTGDIGLAEWGEKHAYAPERDGRNWDVAYRTVAGSCAIGHVLVARLMGLTDVWNWPATFDYYDRYWEREQGGAGRGPNSIQPFVADMWSSYRNLPGGAAAAGR